MALLIAHIEHDRLKAIWLAEQLRSVGRRIRLRNIDDPCEKPTIDDHRHEFNETDIVLLVLSREATSSPRLDTEIDLVRNLAAERQTLRFIPVLTGGAAWPSRYPETKFIALDGNPDDAINELRAAIALPYFMLGHKEEEYEVIFSRIGSPFGQELSVVSATGFGIPGVYMIFPLLQGEGPGPIGGVLCRMCMNELKQAVQKANFLKGNAVTDAMTIVRTLDESAKALYPALKTPRDLRGGLRLGLLIAGSTWITAFTIGRMGGFVVSRAIDNDNEFICRSMDAKCVFTCDPGPDPDLVYAAPIGHLEKLDMLGPRMLSFENGSALVCLSNWIVSPQEAVEIFPEIIMSMDLRQASARFSEFVSPQERRKSYSNVELMTVMLSTRSFF
jgi:hypothetical protein